MSEADEIQFAVHQQCACFSDDLKLSHEIAVLKRIMWYLKSMKNEGILILTKLDSRSLGLKCYIDANFADGWSPDQALDPHACHSRTGYVIFYANCPIIWVCAGGTIYSSFQPMRSFT